MKNVLSHKLEIWAHKIASLPYAKQILKPIYYRYKLKLNKKRNDEFKKHALSVIEGFDKAMQEVGCNYFLIFGSLLGAVREHGFISHDCDIDTAIWNTDYSDAIIKALKAHGFKELFSYEIDNGDFGRELSFEKDNVSIDIFFVYPPIDDYPYIVSQWTAVGDSVNNLDSMNKYGYITGKRLELPIGKATKRVNFESIIVSIPENAEEILRFYYGDEYMVPNPFWTEQKNFKYRKDWPEKKAIYKEF